MDVRSFSRICRKKRAYSFLYVSSSSNRRELVFDNSNKLLSLKGEARMYKIESENISEAQLMMSKISPTANYLIEKIYSVQKSHSITNRWQSYTKAQQISWPITFYVTSGKKELFVFWFWYSCGFFTSHYTCGTSTKLIWAVHEVFSWKCYVCTFPAPAHTLEVASGVLQRILCFLWRQSEAPFQSPENTWS